MQRQNLRLNGCLGQKPAFQGFEARQPVRAFKLRLKLRLNLRLFDSLAKWVAFETGV